MAIKNIQGIRFGRLVAVEPTEKRKYGTVVWKCKCDCGNTKEVCTTYLNAGYTRSCGCLRLDLMNFKYQGDCESTDNKNRTKDKRYQQWRAFVYEKDSYTCQVCNKKRTFLNAHHLEAWDTNEDKRFDVSNGVAMCVTCHKAFHSEYGRGKNTTKQFEEFKKLSSSFDFENDGYKEYEERLIKNKRRRSDKKNKRSKQRMAEKRRAEGMQTRTEYNEQRATGKAAKLQELAELKASNPDVSNIKLAEMFGVSKQTVYRYLKDLAYGI